MTDDEFLAACMAAYDAAHRPPSAVERALMFGRPDRWIMLSTADCVRGPDTFISFNHEPAEDGSRRDVYTEYAYLSNEQLRLLNEMGRGPHVQEVASSAEITSNFFGGTDDGRDV